MEAILSSETSVHTRSTRRHIPEDVILHSHRRENPKYFMSTQVRKATRRLIFLRGDASGTAPKIEPSVRRRVQKIVHCINGPSSRTSRTCNFACWFLWLWIFVSHIKGRIDTGTGLWERGAKENILTSVGRVTGGRRKLHNEELCHLNFSPNLIRFIKSKRGGQSM
jgi:hypothetical protein